MFPGFVDGVNDFDEREILTHGPTTGDQQIPNGATVRMATFIELLSSLKKKKNNNLYFGK